MREMFTDKNFITGKLTVFAKLLLIISLVIFFAPLCILPFFNHPCADDYICGIHLREKGFLNYQLYIYNTWGGRYAATFAGSLFAQNGFLYGHYYFHTLLLIALNIMSSVFLVHTVNKYVLKDAMLKGNIILLALLFTALTLCVLPEPSTYIFWFSSAVTYQLPVILIQLQISLWVMLLHSNRSFAKVCAYVLLPLLCIAINGFNELFVVMEFFIIAFVFVSGWHKHVSKVFMLMMLLCFLVTTLIVVLSPGIQSRAAIIVPKGMFVGVAALGYHLAEIVLSICRQPLFWFTALMVLLYGNYCKEKFIHVKFIKAYIKRKWSLPLFIMLFVVSAVGVAVLGLKGGIIPDRYVNAVIYATLVLLLIYAFAAGVGVQEKYITSFLLKAKLVMPVLLCVGLLANSYITGAYKSIISAPLYNNIMSEREAGLQSAAANKKVAVVKSYDASLQEHLQDEYGQSTQTLYNLVLQKPSFIFFEDDLATEYSIGTLKSFYGVDSIVVK